MSRKTLSALIATLICVLTVATASDCRAIAPVEITKLRGSITGNNDLTLGTSVALRRDLALVGASVGDSGLQGEANSAFLYKRQASGQWTELARLDTIDNEPLFPGHPVVTGFGNSVVLDSTTAIVGGYLVNSPSASQAGAAYVFREKDGVWQEVAKLTADIPRRYAWFGETLALSGNTLFVSARKEDMGAAEVGAVYVFERDSSGDWLQSQRLIGDDPGSDDAFDYFGYSIALDGDVAMIGTINDDTFAIDAGAVYVFERDDLGNWSSTAKLKSTDIAQGDGFGSSVVINGNRALVGAVTRDDAGPSSGAAYLFEKDLNGSWSQTAKFTADDAKALEFFGASVALYRDWAFVSAIPSNLSNSPGHTYIFHNQSPGIWSQVGKFTASDATVFSGFGKQFAVDRNNLLIAASQGGYGYMYRIVPEPTSVVLMLLAFAMLATISCRLRFRWASFN